MVVPSYIEFFYCKGVSNENYSTISSVSKSQLLIDKGVMKNQPLKLTQIQTNWRSFRAVSSTIGANSKSFRGNSVTIQAI